jgi:biopolymer transport protein ExbD
MWSQKRDSDDSTLDMTPLVDVVFLLIIFFMLSTTFIVVPGLRIDLPTAASQKVSVEKHKVVLSVDRNGILYFDQDPVDEDTMVRLLKQTELENPLILVLMKGDRNSKYGRNVDLLDMVGKAGLNRIAIVTSTKKKTENAPDTADK